MAGTVLLIGSTGKTGWELLTLLTATDIPVRAATRNPSAAQGRMPHAVEVVPFDFERPDTFAPALHGVEKVFLMARPGDNRSDVVAAPFVDEARKQGIRHIVNLTAMGVEHDDRFPLRILEKYIEASGIPFTHLRPNWFMQNFNAGLMADDIRMTGALHLPAGNAKLSFVDVRDIAAAGFRTLTDPQHAGKAYTLTGGEALNHDQALRIISRAAGKSIPYIPLREDAARAGLAQVGIPANVIERWTNFYRLVRQGACAPIYADLEILLRRPPISFERYANDYAQAWK